MICDGGLSSPRKLPGHRTEDSNLEFLIKLIKTAIKLRLMSVCVLHNFICSRFSSRESSFENWNEKRDLKNFYDASHSITLAYPILVVN